LREKELKTEGSGWRKMEKRREPNGKTNGRGVVDVGVKALLRQFLPTKPTR
jgi:hypothetical protein